MRTGPEASLYRRNAAQVTSAVVLHSAEKEAACAALPRLGRRKLRAELERSWDEEEAAASAAAGRALDVLATAASTLRDRLAELGALNVPELRGKVEAEIQRVDVARRQLGSARDALGRRDFGEAGQAVGEAGRELWLVGGPLTVTLNQALAQAAIGREQRASLQHNLVARQAAKRELERSRASSPVETLIEGAARVHVLEADGFALAAAILREQVRPDPATPARTGSADGGVVVRPPHELETFEDVGGLEDVKTQLRSTIGAILDRPAEAARYRVVHNGILFHGPPGTGKTLLSRALAGEYGLRYIRFAPSSIASSYLHEAASNLHGLFDTARRNAPCLLFLDEIDSIASAREDQPSGDHREIVTELMNCLEEYRAVPGLVIAAATNHVDRLDIGLREGRFDARILVPLPDVEARREIVRVHLERRDSAVDLASIDLDEIARATKGRNAAALEAFVTLAAQAALAQRRTIRHEDLVAAIAQREGKDRVVLEDRVAWDDVVLPDETREQLMEHLHVFTRPDLADALGVKAPAGLLLYGPPGTGKTTIAKAMATEVAASFYEQSAADLLSKWAGESEENVAKLFTKARANRPSIVFVDEIDGLLRKRGSTAASSWEERVVGQFLRELDGLSGGEGVLLVGATNRIDIVDPAIQGRRLTPVEVGLPDAAGRLRLLQVLCRRVTLDGKVDLRALARMSEGMSGADLKRVRDAAGMKALARAARVEPGTPATMTMEDLSGAVQAQRARSSLLEV